MNFEIIITPDFTKDAKRLIKKYPSLKTELNVLTKQLEVDPFHGTQIMENVYKIRIAIKSKNKGKSGGARTVHFIYQSERLNEVYLLNIYDKSEFSSISNAVLESVIEQLKRDILSEEE